MVAQLHALDLLALQEIDEGIVAEAAHGALGEGEVALVVAATLPAQARLGLGAALGGGLLLLSQALGDSAVVPVERLLHHRIDRSEEHTSELQSLMLIAYAVFCLKKKTTKVT